MRILSATFVPVSIKIGWSVAGVENVSIVLRAASQEHKQGERGGVAAVGHQVQVSYFAKV